MKKKELQAIQAERERDWAHCRKKFEVENLEFRPRNGVAPGVHVIEAYDLDHPAPVGAVWWRWGIGDNNEAEIINSYTFPDLRRLGIRTRLQNYLITWINPRRIITGRCSTIEGIAWMEKYGYRLDRKRGVWYFIVKKKS